MEEQAEYDDDADRLAELLEASEAFDEDVGKLLGKCEARTKRGLITLALCAAAFEHGFSQRVLLEMGLSGTALSLCRLHFEAVVRATWTAECAHDEWLEKFTTPVEGPEHVEPADPLSISKMIKHITSKVKHVGEEYALLNTTIPAMHSFVHSGAQAVVHALMPAYPTCTLMGALWNRNLLHLYTANTAVVAAGNGLLLPRMRLLREKHAGCMPPTRKEMAV
jgi:hypothetical protein